MPASLFDPHTFFSRSAVFAALLLTAGVLLGHSSTSRAQQVPERSVAVGAQVGAPTGLSLQVEEPSRTYDVHLAWRLDRYVAAGGHVLLERGSLPGATELTDLSYQVGPGLHGHVRRGVPAIGPSGMLGVEWRLGTLELFARLAPRIELVPATRFAVGGGLGLRVAP